MRWADHSTRNKVSYIFCSFHQYYQPQTWRLGGLRNCGNSATQTIGMTSSYIMLIGGTECPLRECRRAQVLWTLIIYYYSILLLCNENFSQMLYEVLMIAPCTQLCLAFLYTDAVQQSLSCDMADAMINLRNESLEPRVLRFTHRSKPEEIVLNTFLTRPT